MKDKTKRPSKKNSKKENKNHPYKKRRNPIRITLTEEQLIDISDQENKELGLPSLKEMARQTIMTQLLFEKMRRKEK